MARISARLLIIGAGPAGLAAAATAGAGEAILIDDNPAVGGQIWRAELNKQKHSVVKTFRAAMDRANVRVLNATRINDIVVPIAFAECEHGPIEIEFEKLIIATGARELFLPFPGWTQIGRASG